MPVYEYKCNNCSSLIEFQRGFGEDREPSCCNELMQRVWSSPKIIFNGTGFYRTDYKK